jgi:hypothetical protein
MVEYINSNNKSTHAKQTEPYKKIFFFIGTFSKPKKYLKVIAYHLARQTALMIGTLNGITVAYV